ncbi:MAG: lipoprotein-releasing system permease protein [Flavobacteriales bacterium]|jgi:lipoprotein-releasing system permease protein
MISMVVVAGVTAAMIIILSAFNGIEDLVSGLFSSFDADITISATEGKTIKIDALDYLSIAKTEGVEMMSEVIEEDVWINYGEQNTVATIKGVSPSYGEMSTLDTMMYLGEFVLKQNNLNYSIIGRGIRGELGIRFREGESPIINIHAPKRGKKIRSSKQGAFNTLPIMVGGVYSVNAELDVKYVIAPVAYCKELFGYDDEISALEVDVSKEADVEEVSKSLQILLGDQFLIRTRYQKNLLIYQTNASEKWATFLILLFILIIAAFNIVASLTMLIIEKKKDIFILQSMGVTRPTINSIFILESIFIYFIGAMIGIILGVGLCFLQQSFGLIRLEGAMIPYYPVSVEWNDVFQVILSVMAVGFAFSLILVRYLIKRYVSLGA